LVGDAITSEAIEHDQLMTTSGYPAAVRPDIDQPEEAS
jgi:hypothetical protein